MQIDRQPITPAFDELGAGENALALMPGPGPLCAAAEVHRMVLACGADPLTAMQEALLAAQGIALVQLKMQMERRARA